MKMDEIAGVMPNIPALLGFFFFSFWVGVGWIFHKPLIPL